MIFVTVGTQEPFVRLIDAIVEIAKSSDERFIVQTPFIDLEIENVEFIDFLAPERYMKIFQESKLIISHAGMGTIISALTYNKPLIILPRLVSYGEHRNEHQLATAKKIEELNYSYVAYNEVELKEKVLKLLQKEVINPTNGSINSYASQTLISSLSDFIMS